MLTINAMGKSCPEPVMMTKSALEKGAEELEVFVDNPISATNVKRFLEGKGFCVQLKDDDGKLVISASKKTPAPAPAPAHASEVLQTPLLPPDGARTFSVLITHQVLGGDDRDLGEILIKGFLGTLSKIDTPPTAVALMNEGVKLALFESSACDHLKNLEKKGVAILVCGTCTQHFGITNSVGVGVISNMFEIVETLNKADKILSL